MKAVFRTPSRMAVALIAGLLLAALYKLIYDLFNGYAVVLNLFIGLGFAPSAALLEVLQFFCLAVTAFVVGSALLKVISDRPEKIAFAVTLPWGVLCV